MRAAPFGLITLLVAAACGTTQVASVKPEPPTARPAPAYGALPTDLPIFVNGTRLITGQSVNDIDPATVANVEIIRGTAARRLYGEDAASGVILITTKRSNGVRDGPR